MEGLHPYYVFPEKFSSHADDFFSSYILEKVVACPGTKMTGLIPKQEKVCRFCRKKYPVVGFRKDAHVFPELIGNRYLVSDFECDDCNWTFGRYKDQFSKFLELSRTILAVRGKEKMPKFKSADERLLMESMIDPQFGPVVHAKRVSGDDLVFSYDEGRKVMTISCTRQPFVPLQVYKSFLKMALTCLDGAQIKDYSTALRYVGAKDLDNTTGGFTWIYRYTMPYTFMYEKPVGMIFRKRNTDAPLFSHIFILFALNTIYQLVIPLCDKDRRYYLAQQSIHFPCARLFSRENIHSRWKPFSLRTWIYLQTRL